MRDCLCGIGKIKDKRSRMCRSCAVKLSLKNRLPEVNEKIRQTVLRKGLKPPITHRTDEQNPAWKGGGYDYKHDWIVRVKGKPDTCEKCGKSGLKGHAIQWSNKDHKYRRIIEDWQRLCASCHKLYDNKLRKSKNV